LIGTYISVIRWKNTIKSTSSRKISIFLNAVFEKPKKPGNFQNNLYVTNHVYKNLYFYTRFWWGKPEGKRPLGRHRRRWEDKIKMELQEVGCRGMYWIELAQDRDM
jgi:hypothetical protein